MKQIKSIRATKNGLTLTIGFVGRSATQFENPREVRKQELAGVVVPEGFSRNLETIECLICDSTGKLICSRENLKIAVETAVEQKEMKLVEYLKTL